MMMGNRQNSRLRTAVVLTCVLALVLSSPLVFQGAAARAAAGGSVLSLTPATGTYGIGQTFTVNVTLNTNGEAINAVEADLTFAADKLEVTKMDYTTGGFLTLVLDHSYDNATGHIRLAAGVFSPGFAGAAGHVATVTFHTKAAGTANVTFDATSAVLRNSDNFNVLTGTQPGQFTITGGATMPGGLVVSPSMLSCTEGGSPAGFSVSLASVPTSDVTVTLMGDAQLAVTPSRLTFAPSAWNVPQFVSVMAVDDAVVQGMRIVAVQLGVDSADAAYHNLSASPVQVGIADNDVTPTGHTIIASASGQGGSIAPAGSVAVNQGGAAHFAITPADGFEIDTVTVDGVPADVWDHSAMAYDFRAVTADHTISCTFRLTKDITAPTLVLTGLDAAGTPRVVTAIAPWNLAVHAADDRGPATVKVMEGSATLATASVEGDANLPITVPDGTHQLVLSAVDAAGNVTSRQIQLVVDTTGPIVSFSSIPSSATASPVTLSGRITDALSGAASLVINGSAVQWSADGSFNYVVALTKGANRIDVEAADKLGNKSSDTVAITYAPTLTIVLKIGSPFMTVGGQKVAIDASGKVAPSIQNGRTLLPIRALIEALGGTVGWDSATRKATIELKGTTLQLWIGKSTATVNGRSTPIDAKDKKVMPVIVQGRTLLPLRFVAENLGLDLVWDGAQQIVTLTFEQ